MTFLVACSTWLLHATTILLDTAVVHVYTLPNTPIDFYPQYAVGLPDNFTPTQLSPTQNPIYGTLQISLQQCTYLPQSSLKSGRDMAYISLQNGAEQHIVQIDIVVDTVFTTSGSRFDYTYLPNAVEDPHRYPWPIADYVLGFHALTQYQTRIVVILPDGSRVSNDVNANTFWDWKDTSPHNFTQAYQVFSSAPIVVEAYNHIKQCRDVTNLLPTRLLGKEYLIQTPDDAVFYPNMFTIAATEDNTTVSVYRSQQTDQGAAQTTSSYLLQKGQVHSEEVVTTDTVVFTEFGGTRHRVGSHPSLSSSIVTGDKPIAVFQGNPNAMLGASAGEHIYEQAIPTDMWGTEFILYCDFITASKCYMDVIAKDDNTTISISSTKGTTTRVVNRADTIQLNMGAYYVQSDKPICCSLVTMWGYGDPAQTFYPPLSYKAYYSAFTIHDLYQEPWHRSTYQVATIIVPTSSLSQMKLDGSSYIRAAWIGSFSLKPGYSIITFRLEANQKGRHTIESTGEGFTGFFYGLGIEESYLFALPRLYQEHKMPLILKDTICPNEYTLFHGDTLREAGTYTYIPGSESIYSLEQLELTVVDNCPCDTAYSTTYKQIREDELPTFQWNGIPMTTMPQNEQRDTTLVFPTMKMDASCDSIATLRLHVLGPCEMPSTPYPAYWRDPQSMHH